MKEKEVEISISMTRDELVWIFAAVHTRSENSCVDASEREALKKLEEDLNAVGHNHGAWKSPLAQALK